MKPGLQVLKDDFAKLAKSLDILTKNSAYVGIPEEKASRPGEPINNAELLFIHTNGAPEVNIPARPVIEPAIEAKGNIEPITAELTLAAEAALDGNAAASVRHLKRAGQEGENAARAWFTDARNGWAPNAPSTIAAKGSDRPLIDKDEMRKAIISVVRES